MQAAKQPKRGVNSLRLAPLGLLFFVAVAVYLTPGEPAVVSISSLGFGYAVGWALRRPAIGLRGVASWYFGSATVVSFLMGRPLPVAVVTALTLAALVALLAVAGDRMGLHGLQKPSDAIKLMALAAASGIAIPIITVVNSNLLGRSSELTAVLPQTALTGVTGVLLTGWLMLSWQPSQAAVHGVRQQAELFTLTGIGIFLLLGINLMDAKTIASAGPLFLLVVVLSWQALRFGPSSASMGVVTASIWICAGVMDGRGAFVTTTVGLLSAVLAAQIYITVLASGVLMLSVYASYSGEQDATARRTAEILSSAADSAATQVYIKHYDAASDRFRYVDVNEIFAAELGLAPTDVVGRSDEDLHSPQAAARFREQDDLIMTTGKRHRFETPASVNGRRVSYFSSKFPVRDRNDTIIGVGGVTLDRTEERRRATMMQLMFDRSPVPTARLAYTSKGLGKVLEVNDAFASLVATPALQLAGNNLDRLVVASGALFDPDGPSTQRREVRLRRSDGSELTVVATTTAVSEHSEQIFALVILEDVTATRAAEAGLVHRATHDPLTDLFNRQALIERLAARGVGKVPAGVALWCCDLDGLKQFNDSLGHDTGDRVLLEMAERVRTTVADADTVGRLGADEFVIFSGALLNVASALEIGEEIRAAVAQPLEMDGRTHSIRVSVGVAVSDGEVDADELLRQADVALSRAKDLGRDRIELYLPELDRRVQLRSAVRETLRKALAENRIGIEAQPLIDLSTGATVGAESLVRLRDLDGTVLPPAAFIGVAEESGLIMPLGMRVLDLSLALCARWLEQGTPIEIAVNVSPRQLQDADFPATVATLLQVHGVPSDLLVLEVTESTVVDATGPTLAVLREIRQTGVHVAIDDFGTGYSSLSSLRELPADIVKIDRSFVSGMCFDAGDEAIVRAVLAMAHATDRVVVAEGVETQEQAQRLAELNCDRVQGYWFSRPLAAIDFDATRVYSLQSEAPRHARPTSPS